MVNFVCSTNLITMKKLSILLMGATLIFGSCVSGKKYKTLQSEFDEMKNSVYKCEDEKKLVEGELSKCQNEAAGNSAKLEAQTSEISSLKDQINNLHNTNASLLTNLGDLATLSTKEAENLERSLEAIKEKDLQIKTMNDALNKKDSVTLALVTSLKGVLGNINDKDIQVEVEKGVVFISIADKMLFESGSSTLSKSAQSILSKVADVVNDKPEMEFLVEGHTDDVPISKAGIKDNWELSVLRACAVVRVLQEDFEVDPARMTAAGRSFYAPVADNSTPENRSKNRRTRIVVLPKMDQFYEMIEQGMEEAE